MTDFDRSAYLKQRLASTGVSKASELLEARTAKYESLRGFGESPTPTVPAAPDKSWVGRLGLDPEGTAGELVNAAAELASGTTRVIGHAASAIPSMIANSAESMLDEEDYLAYNRFVTGKASDADIARLTAQKQPPSAVAAKTGSFGPGMAGPTAMELFDKSEDHRTVARNINKMMDTGSIVQQDQRNKLRDALNSSYKNSDGAVDLVSGAVDAIADNPRAAAGYVLENIPQIALGMLGKAGKAAMASSNVGYGTDTLDQGLEAYAAKNDGQLPEKATRNRMQGEAAAIVAAEQIGEMVGLAGIGKIGKAGKEAAEELRTSLLQSGKQIAKAVTTGTATEAATEGYQTLLEESIKGNVASGEDVYAGAVIGGVSGGTISGGGRTLAEVARATPEHIDAAKARANKAEEFQKAVDAGDHTIFLDEKSDKYDPQAAVRVLYAAAQKDGATPEQKAEAQAKATEVVTNLETKQQELQEKYDDISEAGLKKTQAQLARLETQLAKTDPANTDRVEALKDGIAEVQEQIAGYDNVIQANKKGAAQLEKQIAALNTHITDATRVRDEFISSEAAKVKDSDVEADVELADQGNTEAASRVINLSMSLASKLAPKSAARLAANMSNGLTLEQRDYLRAFSEARQTENQLSTMKKVSQEILTGTDKNLGIAQYRANIGAAIMAGNKKVAERYLGMLDSFREDHRQKARIARKAMEASTADKQVRHVLKGDSGWYATTDLLSEKDRIKNGGLEIHPIKSKNLVPALQTESDALTLSHRELTSAAGLRFGTKAVQSNPSQAAPQAPSTPATPSATTSPPATQTEDAPGKNNLPPEKVEDKTRPSPGEGEPVASQQQEKGEEVNKSGSTPSSSSTASAPIAVAGAPAQGYAASSTPAAEAANKPAETAASSNENEAAKTTDAQSGQAAEQQDDTSEASGAPAAEAAPAGLRVFSQKQNIKGKLNEIWGKVNPVAQFLKQELTSERYKTARPLVASPSFLASWKADAMFPLQFVEEGEAVLDNNLMKMALNSLEAHLEKWAPLVNANLGEFGGSEKYKSEDLMQYLIERTEKGALQVEENVATAIAYSMYSWVLGQSNSPAYQTPTEVAKMHGRGKDAYIDPDGYNELKVMAGFEDRVIHELGDVAAQALGLRAEANAPGDLLPRLKMALGTHALLLLASPQVGLIKRAALPSATVQGYFRIDGDVNEELDAEEEAPASYGGVNAYVRLVRNGTQLSDSARSIRDANVQSRGIVDRLFGADKAARVAGTKPVEFTQKYAKGTQQEVSAMQAKVIQESMDDPFRPIPEMMYTFMGLGRDMILKIAGHRDLETEFVHDINKDSTEAQNMNLENQFDQGMEGLDLDPQDMLANFTPEVLTTPRYIEQNVWKNFRAGFSNQSLNPQTSKIHRALFAREGWTAKLDLTEIDMVNEFKIAIAMGLGMKTDQQRNSATLVAFEAELKDADLTGAIDALRRAVVLKDDAAWTDESRALVANVAKGREGMQTLQAMTMYAKFLEAQQAGDKEVEVTLLVGVDGKTNGPMLSHLALGAADDIDGFYTLLNRGGFFSTDAGQADHYAQWYEGADSQDLYEDLGGRIIDRVGSLMSEEAKLWRMRKSKDPAAKGRFTFEQMKAVEAITKPLMKEGKATSNMRKLTKVPLTSFAFGSSLTKSIENMQQNFIDSFYKNIESMAADKVSDNAVTEYLGHVNQLIAMGGWKDRVAGLNPALPIEALLTTKLSPAQEQAMREAFRMVIGTSVKAEMESYFATFIERRRQLNNTIQSAYQVYEAAYAAAKMKEMDRLMDAGEVAYRVSKAKDGTETRVPWHDLTPKQEKALRDSLASLLPVMHNHYSIGENSLKAGLYMAKSKSTISSSPLYRSKVYTKNKVNKAVLKDGELQKEASPHLSSQAQTRVEQSPGVAGAAYSIHSSDSSIMHQMLAKVKGSLNVHDEGGNGVHKVREVARGLNQATAETFLEYSPAREAVFMLERAITNMAKQVRAGVVTPDAVVRMYEDWAANYAEEELSPQDAAERTLSDAISNAYRADRMRLTALSKLKSVDQYVWEGGQFVVDQAFRDKAAAKLKGLDQLTSKATLADLAYLTTQYELNKDKPVQAAKWVDIKREERSERVQDKEPPVAKLGTSAIASNPALVAAFKKTPTMNLKQTVAVLRGQLKDDFSQKLLSQLERSAGDISFQYVTPDTAANDLLDSPKPGARGYFVSKGDQRMIYVLSPDFEQSGLTPEVMLHELTHAALVNITRNPTADAKPLIAELQGLMNAVQSQITGFDAAFTNLDEFIAYGMTNADFQAQLQSVLVKPSQNTGNRLVQAMKQFIGVLGRLLFGRANAVMENGLGKLVINVSGLLQAAAESQPGNSDVNLSIGASSINTTQIYDGLAQTNNGITVSTGFDFHLRRLLDGIVSQIHGPFGVFKDLIATTQATDVMDIWLEAKQTGVTPFASQVLGLNLHFTEQEAFVLEQVEATVRAAISGNEGQTTAAYRELRKLFEEAAAKLTPQDFTNAGLDASLHGFIFNVRAGAGNRSDYLSQFAALGLANEKFASLLGFNTKVRTPSTNPTFVDRLYAAFEAIMALIAGKLTNTYAGQPADEKLETLINTLVQIEVKKREKLTQQKLDFVQHAEDRIKQGADLARRQIEKFGQSKLFQNSRFSTVQATGTAISLVAGDRVEQFMENLNELRDQRFHRRQGFVAGALNEMRGTVSTNLESQRLLREAKNNERHRKEEDDLTAQYVMESFDKLGADLTVEQKHAITAVFLRTGMHTLTDPVHGFSLQDLLKLISVPAALDREIAAYEKQLAKSPFATFYINAADGLGLYMAGGPVKTRRLLKNAHSIARMHSTQYRGRVTESQAQNVEPVIDALASLYALRHTEERLLKDAAAVFKTELARTKGNGVEMVMKLHARLENESRDRLFRGSEALMMKGYMPEIYDPFMDIQAVTAAEGAELVDQGYSPGMEVAIDPTDTEKRFLHARRDGGLQRFQTGAFAYDGMRAKGTKTHNGDTSLTNPTGMQNASAMAAINNAKAADVQDMMARRIDMRVERKNEKHTFKAPILNPAGDVVNWAYLMEGSTKDTLLHRDNRMEQVLGRLAGSIVGKETATKHNRVAVEALKAQYDAEYATKTASYITISPSSADADMRQIWNMLPENTKQAVREVWGREAMVVRIDTLDLNFGYRKLTLSSAFDKDPDARNIGERLFVQFWEAFLGKKAELWVRRGEDVWETIVREAKDIIVVKSGITLLGNQLSNMSLLLAYGVRPVAMLHHHRIALQGAMAYRKDNAELFRLQRALDIGDLQGRTTAAMQSEINKLKDALQRNPVRDLIDAGLMPTIVEDIANDEDLYSYKSQFTKAVQDRLEAVNPKVLGAAKFLYMTHDTRAYRALSYGTQLSDFVARYTLYQHLTTGKDAIAPAEAVQRASDAFINYDIPSHRVMQKMNDLGLFLFTKYFMRVQKVIAHLYRENPGRALSLLAFNSYFDWVPTIMDSGFFARDMLPTGMGALMYPTLLDDTVVMKALASPFK